MQNVIESAKDIKLQAGECITSYDITALFTSVQVAKVLSTIHNKLVLDQGLLLRTALTIQHIIERLGFCLHNTYFLFQGKYYEQLEGLAMGSLVSLIVTNICMEYFEDTSLRKVQSPPRLQKRLEDNTLVILYAEHKESFL